MVEARKRSARDRTLIETLHFTGRRPSELIEITPARIDLSGGTVTIRSLKKRKDAIRLREPRVSIGGKIKKYLQTVGFW
ncbi:site-specific integrase [Roseobacter fucihabitans]|uniref:site-specific integrase n=1 Tax=Roseobacter fucihabitans TaxID=1537242 RepID=UPI0021CCB159|nr:site-specific integrase [Roseobacter litoralis]